MELFDILKARAGIPVEDPMALRFVSAAREQTITGVPPIYFRSTGRTLTEYKISGSTVQDGTPSQSSPVEVVGCGEWDAAAQQYRIPITCGGVTNAVYIGSDPLHKIGDYADFVDYSAGTISRRVVKLVLEGTEDWAIVETTGTTAYFRLVLSSSMDYINGSIGFCTHYERKPITTQTTHIGFSPSRSTTYGAVLSLRPESSINTVTKLKQFLAQQYADGTPVTVWYVLAEPVLNTVSLPAITPAAGANELTVGTDVQPSSVSITGRIKELEYRFVEYLKSSGTQYVITDMISTYDMKFEIDMKIGTQLSGGSYVPWFLFGYYENDLSKPSHTVATSRNAERSDVYIGYNYQAYSTYSYLFHFANAPISSRNTLVVQKTGSCSWGNETLDVSQIPQYSTTQPADRFPIFGVCSNGVYSAYQDYMLYLYGFKVYRNQVLLHDFRPAERKQDSTLGLFDFVTGKFYTNAGTGTFEKGGYLS